MRGQRAFCDVRVFNPLAKCHRSKPLAKIHEMHEKEEKVKYATGVTEIEHGSFTPLVFSCFGGMSRECSYFYKPLAETIAEKRQWNNMLCKNKVKLLTHQVTGFMHPWITSGEERCRFSGGYRHYVSKSDLCNQERSNWPLEANVTALIMYVFF